MECTFLVFSNIYQNGFYITMNDGLALVYILHCLIVSLHFEITL